jgi:hypothetical protein
MNNIDRVKLNLEFLFTTLNRARITRFSRTDNSLSRSKDYYTLEVTLTIKRLLKNILKLRA